MKNYWVNKLAGRVAFAQNQAPRACAALNLDACPQPADLFQCSVMLNCSYTHGQAVSSSVSSSARRRATGSAWVYSTPRGGKKPEPNFSPRTTPRPLRRRAPAQMSFVSVNLLLPAQMQTVGVFEAARKPPARHLEKLRDLGLENYGEGERRACPAFPLPRRSFKPCRHHVMSGKPWAKHRIARRGPHRPPRTGR